VSVSAVLYPRWRSNLGIFWLKIEQFWPFEEISIFSNGGHLGYRMALMDTILKLYKLEKKGYEIKIKISEIIVLISTKLC
jgi:hypothetical protein